MIALATRPDGEDGGKFFMTDMGMIYVKEAVPGLLSNLARSFDLVWATGWEHHANRELAGVLGLESELPVLTFGGKARRGTAHWKIEEVERYAGSRAMAWLDDSLDERHDVWAKTRSAPTLLVRADDRVGITADLVAQLLGWAASLDADAGAIRRPLQAAGSRCVVSRVDMAEEQRATLESEQRFDRTRQTPRSSDQKALLDRLERQAESIGQLTERVENLQTRLERAQEESRTLQARLKKERETNKRQLASQTELEKRVQSIHDNAEELARERRTVTTLQTELGRAWTEVRALQSAQTGSRWGRRGRSDG